MIINAKFILKLKEERRLALVDYVTFFLKMKEERKLALAVSFLCQKVLPSIFPLRAISHQ